MKHLIHLLALLLLVVPVTSSAQYTNPYSYPSQQPPARSGSTYDSQSGNMYNWQRDSMGNTHVQGSNMQNGTMWNQEIDRHGNQRGIDSRGNSWTYDRDSGNYYNYGTGKMCTGHGAARVCN